MLNSGKFLCSAFLFLGSLSAVAAETPIRTCSVKIPGGSLMSIDLYQNEAVTRQSGATYELSTTDTLKLVDGNVRVDLANVAKAAVKEMMNPEAATDSTAGLNHVELSIVHAMMLPLLRLPDRNAGFDLNAVRSAQVYLLGEASNWQAAVVVGKDASGNELGSFLSGTTAVSPCEK